MKTRSAFLAAITAVLLLTGTAAAKTKTPKPTIDQVPARQQPQSAQPGTFEAKVEDFLRQSGYEYHKVKANSWYLLATGKQMTQIRIILGAGPSSIAMGAVVVPKRNLRITSDALYKLMKLSYDLNYVRVCIDSDDDLIVMSQVKDPWLTAAEFRNTINQVAGAADRAYGIMRPFLNTP